MDSHLSGLIWAVMLLSAAIAITLPKPAGIRTLIITAIIRLIYSVGPEPTLALLGSTAVSLISSPSAMEPTATVPLPVLTFHDRWR